MTGNVSPALRSVSWSGRRISTLILVAVIILPLILLSPAAPPAAATANAQPELLALAVQQPQANVRVIAQIDGQPGQVQALVQELGGSYLKELQIIDAFVAQLPAQAAVQLAANPATRWVSLDGPVQSAGNSSKPAPGWPANTYLDTINVTDIKASKLGEDITVAVIDSGVSKDSDFTISVRGSNSSRVLAQASFSANSSSVNDVYGHGTHVAGIIAGNGRDSNGNYVGVAPKANLISLKVSDGFGFAYESDVVAAMQWVLEKKDRYNIRVVNLSLNTTTEQSYHNSPMDAAAEILWFNGVVVVASAGNKGPAGGFNTANASPANDPFIITVGASDEKGTAAVSDDVIAPFSAYGTTPDGFLKPDIIAPGKSIISVLSSSSDWGTNYPERTYVDGQYFSLSGTSMAAPMVTGAVVAMLHHQPSLTPDQVKYRLLNSGPTIGSLDQGGFYPYLDVKAAIDSTVTQSANTGLVASQLLWTGSDPVSWDSVSWNSVSWNSVSWNSVSWNSVSWNSVSWNSVFWSD